MLGKIRGESVYKMIGGATVERLNFYCTRSNPIGAKESGFIGAKVHLPCGLGDGPAGLLRNVEYLAKHREEIGPAFPLRVDCYMSLNVPYTIQLVKTCEHLNIDWWEECLSPDDTDGFELLKRAHPTVRLTTGGHEVSRYGFRKLVEGRNLDVIQPDIMSCGGLTELLKISALAAAYDINVIPHAGGPYSYHFVVSQSNALFQRVHGEFARWEVDPARVWEPVPERTTPNERISRAGGLRQARVRARAQSCREACSCRILEFGFAE